MNEEYLPYIIMEGFCIINSVAILLRLSRGISSNRETMTLKKMIAVYLVEVVMDIAWTCVDGQSDPFQQCLFRVICGVCITVTVAGCYYWYQFVEDRLGALDAIRKRIGHWEAVPALIAGTMDLASIFTGWIYYIDSGGNYIPGRLFLVQRIVCFSYLLIPTGHSLYWAISTREVKKRREYLTYVEYICLPVAVVMVLEDYFDTVPLFALSIFTVILILFLTLYLNQEYELAERDKKLMESHMEVMLSQIQPHFLYNALAVIQDMCHGKAPEAEQTTVEFAEFLRGNLDSLDRRTPIPFIQELQHTRTYLTLEGKRFGDCLRVAYDIQATAFSIPALTLQPIVENAVRHGVLKREDGGFVRITSAETKKAFIITVMDNGVGFDVESKLSDGSVHIGLDNVNNRLKELCGGSLSVKSRPRVGTTVVITVPKRDMEWKES